MIIFQYMSRKAADESNIRVDIKNQKWAIVGIVNAFLERYNKENAKELRETFSEKYDALIKQHEQEDLTELSQFYRLVSEFRLALESVLETGPIYENLSDRMVEMFDITLAGIQRQVDNKTELILIPCVSRCLLFISKFCFPFTLT